MPSTVISGFDEETATAVDGVLDHLQANHADTVRFLASHAGEPVDGATAAEVIAIDTDSITFEVSFGDGSVLRHFSFSAPVGSSPELQAALFGLLDTARASAPDHPITSIEEMLASTASLQTYLGTVASITPITPGLIELSIDVDLGEAVDLAGDEFWFLMVPRPGAPSPIVPGFTIDDRGEGPEASRPFGAYYTTRRRRSGGLDVWVVLHGHDDGVGGWAAQAEPGTTVAVWGPRSLLNSADDVTSHLLVCDDTGLAACAAIIETIPDDRRVVLVAEVRDADHEPPMPAHPRLETVFVHRGDDPPGEGRRLLDTVETLDLDVDGLEAFGAGESRQITAVRRHLRDERGLPRTAVHLSAYWRR